MDGFELDLQPYAVALIDAAGRSDIGSASRDQTIEIVVGTRTPLWAAVANP